MASQNMAALRGLIHKLRILIHQLFPIGRAFLGPALIGSGNHKEIFRFRASTSMSNEELANRQPREKYLQSGMSNGSRVDDFPQRHRTNATVAASGAAVAD